MGLGVNIRLRNTVKKAFPKNENQFKCLYLS